MATVADLRRQIEQLDRQIIELLARRTKMAKSIHMQIPEEEEADWDEQVLSNWLEQSFDFGMDEGGTQKVCKSVIELAKKTAEI